MTLATGFYSVFWFSCVNSKEVAFLQGSCTNRQDSEFLCTATQAAYPITSSKNLVKHKYNSAPDKEGKQKSTKANFIKLHRKRRHHERFAMRHSQRLKVKSFLCITEKLLKQV